MIKQITVFFMMALLFVSLTHADDIELPYLTDLIKNSELPFLTSNLLYCKLKGCTMKGDIDMGNNSIINANWVNKTYSNVNESCIKGVCIDSWDVINRSDESNWNWINNDSVVLDNGTIIREHNTSWITSN